MIKKAGRMRGAAAGLSLLAAGCVSTGLPAASHRSVEEILAMPFDSISLGIAPKMDALPEKLPSLQAGEAVVFYIACDGKPYFRFFDAEKRIFLTQPAHEPALGSEAKQGGVETAKEHGTVSASGAAGHLSIGQTNLSLTSEGSEHNVSSLAISQQVQSVASDTALQFSREVRTQTAQAGSATVESATTSIITQTESEQSEVKTSQEITETLAVSAKTEIVAATEEASTSQASGGGWLERFLDQNSKSGIFDEIFKSLLEDASNLIGLTDSQFMRILIDGRYAPTPEEQQAFISLLRKNPDLLALLNRDFSQGFREIAECKVAETGFRGEQVSIAREGMHYHGHPFGMMTTIDNSGRTPLYDLLIVAKAPANVRFGSFLVNNPAEGGFLHFFLEDQNLFVTKIYRPIQPGERFNDVSLFNVDPWDLVIASDMTGTEQTETSLDSSSLPAGF